VDVAAGNNFSLVLSAEGTVFSFGCGKVLFTLPYLAAII
jgi:alpha-tubulin suppressor-like RCC1 family protein